MFYTGQAVFIPSEKRLGIFCGHTIDSRYPYKPYMYVFTLLGDDGSESYTQVYDVVDIVPISKSDKKGSVTGQSSYKTPFQKPSISRTLSEAEAESLKPRFIEEMIKLMKAKWVKTNYEIDTNLTKR